MKVALMCKRRGKHMATAMRKQKIKVKLIDDNNLFSRCIKSIFTKSDVYHTDNSYIEALVAGLNALLKRKTASITIRGKDYLLHRNERHNFLTSFILGRIEILSFLLANKIFFVCKDTFKEYLKKYPWICKKACVPYNGVDFKRFSSGKANDVSKLFPTISPKDKILIFVSNFRYKEKSKGSKMVFDALQYIKNPVKILVIGDGESLHLAKKYAQKIKNKVIFTGFRKDIPELLKSADFFVYSSYLDGLPTAVLEAQSAALPVVVNKKDGIPEAVAPGSGFIVKNAEEFAEKIQFLLDNPEKNRQMGKNAQKYMKENFSWDNIVKRYIKEWEKIKND